MDDVIGISQKISAKISSMEEKRKALDSIIERKKKAAYEYFKQKEIIFFKLKNRETIKVNLKQVKKNYHDSMINVMADLICKDEKIAYDLADMEFRAALASLRSIQTELNGYQTMIRYLEEI